MVLPFSFAGGIFLSSSRSCYLVRIKKSDVSSSIQEMNDWQCSGSERRFVYMLKVREDATNPLACF